MPRQSHVVAGPCWLNSTFASLITLVVMLCFATSLVAAEPAAPPRSSAAARQPQQVARALPLLPMAFEANDGQTDARVRFLSRGPGYTLFLAPTETVLTLSSGQSTSSLRLAFSGAARSATLEARDELRLKTNYFIGNDPSKWRRGVRNFGRVFYRGLYPGVDAAFYGNQGRLENDFLLAAGADPNQIKWEIQGAQRTYVDHEGNLVLSTAEGEVRLLKPRAYQEIGGERRAVAASYRVSGRHVSFVLGNYDRKRALVIDPAVDYLTYVTAASALTVNGIAVNSSGNAFMAGTTPATSFPSATTHNHGVGDTDVFVLELASDGTSALAATFLGGTGSETVGGIAVGSSDNVYVTGSTLSATDFPISSSLADSGANFAPPNAANADNSGNTRDIFLVKLDSAITNILYSTYTGGNADDIGTAIAVLSPNALLTGSTTSTSGFDLVNGKKTSITSGAEAGFVEVVNTLVAGSLTGDSCSTATDIATATWNSNPGFAVGDIVSVKGVPSNGATTNFNVTGAKGTVGTTSAGYVSAVTSGHILYQLAAGACKSGAGNNTNNSAAGGTITGQIKYGSYVGGTGATSVTIGHGIAASGLSRITVVGETTSGALSALNNTQSAYGGGSSDGFVAAYDATNLTAGSTQLFATYLGGAGADVANAVAMDTGGDAYVAGTTTSTETTGALCKSNATATCFLQTANAGGQDAFVVKLNTSTTPAIVWSTYIGGSGDEQVNAAVLDQTNNLLYVGGSTTSSTIKGTAVGQLHGAQDGFVTVVGGPTSAANSQTFKNTYFLGGMGSLDSIAGMAVDASGRLYAGGNSDSLDLTSQLLGTTASAYQPVSALGFDLTNASQPAQLGFAARINADYANPTAATLAAPETLTNLTAGQSGTNNVYYCSTCATQAGVVHYSYSISASGATANDVVFNWPAPRKGGTIVGLPVLSGGSGYTANHTYVNGVTFTDAGGGSGATADVVTDGSGAITQINITSPGSGYTSQTTAALSGTVTTAGTVAVLDTSLVKPGAAFLTTGNVTTTNLTGSCTNAALDGNSANPGLTCAITSLPVGTPATVAFDATATPAATATGAAINFAAAPTVGAANATISSLTSGTITSLPVTDLQLTDVASVNPVKVGGSDTITYTLAAKNNGPTDEPSGKVTVTDTLPIDFAIDYAAFSPTIPAGWSCPDPGAPALGSAATLTCSNTATFANGGTATFAVVGAFAANANLGGSGSDSTTRFNHASIQSTATVDSAPGDNVPTDITTTVQRMATITLAAVSNPASGSTVNLDATVTYTLSLSSAAGPGNASVTGVVLNSNLPAGFHAASAVVQNVVGTPVTSSCDGVGGTGCTSVTLNPGDSFDYVVTGKYPSTDTNALAATAKTTTKTLSATVQADVTPAATNPGAVTLTVQRSALLTLAASGPAAAVNLADNTVTYKFTVTSSNTSANIATGVVVTPNLPPGFVAAGVSINGTPTGAATNTSSCTLANLNGTNNVCTGAVVDIGGSFEVDVTGAFPDDNTVITDATVASQLQHNATAPAIAAAVVDATTNPAGTALDTTVQRSATLALAIAPSSTTVNLDQTMTYTVKLTSNSGSATSATNGAIVVGAANLPAGFHPTGASAMVKTAGNGTGHVASGTGTCDTTTTVTGCTGAVVAPGGEIDYIISGTYPSSDPAALAANAASVSGKTISASGSAAVVDNAGAIAPATDMTVTVQRSATLTLTVAGDKNTVNLQTGSVAAPITYTVTVSSGPACPGAGCSANTATNVNLSNTVPTGLVVTNVVATPAGGATVGTCDTTATATGCTGATIPPAGSIAYAITGNYPDGTTVVAANQASVTRTDTASVTATIVDTTPSNISNTPATTVQRSAALSLTAANDAPLVSLVPTINLGGTVHYTVMLSNAGPDTATNIALSNVLPGGMICGAASNSSCFVITGISVTDGTNPLPNANTLCDTTGGTGCAGLGGGDTTITIAPSGKIVYTVTGNYTDFAPNPSVVANNQPKIAGLQTTANSTASVNPTAPTNQKDTALTVQRSATLNLTVTGSANTVNLHTTANPAPITYTVTLSSSNTSADIATNVNLANTIPSGLAVTSVTPATAGGATQGTCDTTATATGCTGAAIPPGGSITYTVNGNYPDGTTVVPANAATVARTNKATATASIVDTTPSNIVNAPSTTVQRASDLLLGALSATSGAIPLTAFAGQPGPMLITVPVQNAGPDTALSTVVNLTMHTTGYTPLNGATTGTTAGWTCSGGKLTNSTQITCSIGSLAVTGTPSNFVLAVQPDAGEIGITANPPTATILNSPSATISSFDSGTSQPDIVETNAGNNTPPPVGSYSLQRQSDLTFGTFTDKGTVPLGGTLTFSTQVKTLGPDPAYGVVVSYDLHATGFTVSGTQSGAYWPGGCTFDPTGEFLTCLMSSNNQTQLAVGAPQTFEVAVQVPNTIAPSAGQSSATISTTGTISTSSNCCSVDTEVKNGADTAPLSSTVARIGDLAVTAISNTSSAGNPTALAGPIHITAGVTNNKVTVNSTQVGNDATNVKVVLQLPSPNYTLVANSWTGAFSNCVQGQDAQGNTVSNAFVTCSIALVPITQTVNGVVDITPDPNAVAVSGNTAQVSIVATASSAEVLDPTNTTNNDAKTDPNVFLARRSDLQITAATDTSSTTPVPLSGTVSLQTTIFNNGPDAAPGQALAGSAGVSVIYSLSLSGFSFVSSSNPALYGCSQTNSTTITCQLTNTLASGTSQTYTINLKPPTNPTFTAPPNSALVTTTITGRATDAYDDGVGGVAGANNTLAANSTIARVADLRVIAATDNSPVGTAGPLTFFTTLQDVGPDDANNVQAVYVLPASWTTASVTTPSVVTANPYSNCSVQATTPLQLVCTVGSLQVSDGQKTFQASVTPDPNSPSSVTTGAEVQSATVYDDGSNGAPNFAGNNKVNFNTTLVHVINLAISSFTGSPAKGTFTALGSANPVTYTITLSNAAKTSGGAFTSPAAGVFLALDVPPSFTKVNTSGTGWDCTAFPLCNYTQNLGTFSSSGSPGSTTLTVTGYYNDDPTLNLAASQGFLAGQAPVMFGATAGSTDNTAVQDSGNPFVEQKVETDIQRLVSVNVSSITPSVTTTPLNSTVSYDVKVANAAGMNQATQLKVSLQLPSNFINGALDSGNSTAGWTCGTFTAGSTVTCTQSSALAGGTTYDLVFTGQYDDASTNLTNNGTPGQGTATITATPSVTQAVEKNLTDLAPVSQGITLERLVHLSVAQSNGLLGNPTNLGGNVTNQVLVSNAATTTVNAQQVATNSAVSVKVSWGIDPLAKTVFNVNPTATNTNSPGWTCTYPTGSATTVSPVVCTYSGTIGSGASAAPLNIIGQYSDLITDTHITGGTATVAAVATLDMQNADFDPSFTATWNTSTNIQRSVQLSIQQQTVTLDPVSLGTQVGYAVAVGNAGGLNTADTITVTFNLPNGFTYANKFSSPNGDWTNCTLNGSALTCTLDSLQSGRTSDAVTIFGNYSTGLNLSTAGQTQLTVDGNLATSASLDSGSPTVKTFSVTSTVQRAVDLTASASPVPGVVGGAAVLGTAGGDPAANTVTYTVTVKNTSGLDASGGSTADPNAVQMTFAVDAVNGDPTVLGALAAHFKTTSVLVSGNTVAVTCDSVSKPGQVFCNYQNQPANSTTTFTISGQFDGSVVLTGSALANAAAKIVSTDSYDVSLTNNSGTTQVAVVDTPASGITNPKPTVLYTTTAPLSLRYDNVTTAGITTLATSNTAPANFVQPPNSPVDYTSVVAPYFSAATDATYPVAATGLVTACVNINPAGFANPERVRIFDQKGTDITNALALSGTPAVCGATPVAALVPGSPLGFTVREPVLHKPTAQMVTPTQVLTGGSHGGTSNLFTISASGTVDSDFGQICNGTPSGSGLAQFCGDTLTYVFKGPVGMGINQAGNWSPDFSTLTVVVPAVNGAQGTPPSFTGTFPVGVSAVNLTVTDQTGQASSTSVNVALNSFTLGGSNVTSATILAGQSTSFTFSPTVLINGIQLPASFAGDMTLTCDGTNDANHSSLAANHMACTMSPSTITQGQSSQVLITTTGPNFSRLRPAAPGSQGRELVAVLAITLFPAFGFVLLPNRRSRKGLLLLILLLAAMTVFMVGCGGGATVQPPAQNVQAQTPAGTYTITVTGSASGGVVSSSTFTVTVK